MINNVVHLNSLRIIFIFVILSTLLTGCLVDDDDAPELKEMNGNFNLRLIQNNDSMHYRISGTKTVGLTPVTVTGNLSVFYADRNLQLAFGGSTIPVIEETSELTLDDGTDVTAIRFLQQAVDGTLTLIAYGTIVNPDYATTDPAFPPTVSGEIIPVEILESPILQSGVVNLSYNVWEDCDVSPCGARLRGILETLDYFGVKDITTDIGRFETLAYNYTGNFVDIGPPLASPLDIRMACDPNGLEYRGETYIHPAVGIVEMFNSCTDSTGAAGHSLRITLRSTNFDIP